jgi:hypothetical protein
MTPRLLAVAALAAAALAVVPSSASAALRSYGGTTGDGQPLVLGFNPATGRIDRAVVMFSADCKSGRGYSFGHRLTRGRGQIPMVVKKQRGGRFTAVSAAAEELQEGRVAAIGIRLRGRVRGNLITGTLEAEVAVGMPESEEPEDTCTYRRRSFRTTHARGRVLTGETSQSLPVVINLTRNARSIKVIRIGWSAECEPPGFIQIPDELTNFRIRRGAFGDEFDQTIPLDDGTSRIFRCDLKGRANRLRASGTIDVEMEDRGGPAPGVCRTDTVRWRAS